MRLALQLAVIPLQVSVAEIWAKLSFRQTLGDHPVVVVKLHPPLSHRTQTLPAREMSVVRIKNSAFGEPTGTLEQALAKPKIGEHST